MYAAPPESCCQLEEGDCEPHEAAWKSQSVESVLATCCICVGVLYGADSLSKQWLAL